MIKRRPAAIYSIIDIVCSVKGFRNHLIFYIPTAADIEIVHVLHGARDVGPILDEEI